MQVIDTEAVAMENCFDVAAFAAFLEYEDFDTAEDAVEAFQDSYAGSFESLTAWAENFIDEAGLLAKVPETLRRYFDFEAWARDTDLNGDVWTAETPEGTAVFWRR